MIRRFQIHQGGSPPAPISGVNFDHVDVLSSDSHTVTEKTFIAGGPAGGSVTVSVVDYGTTDSAHSYFNVVSQGTLVLGDQFVLPLDGSGKCNFTSITNFGGHPGGIRATLGIIAVSSGAIGNPSTRNYSKTG